MDNRTLNIMENINTRWQPAFTSTPLKLKTRKWGNNSVKNIGIAKHDNLLDSVLNHYQKLNNSEKSNETSKKNSKKKKHLLNFDESSSSADEDVTNTSTKNSEVKINLRANSRIEEKEIDIKFEESKNSTLKNVKSKRQIISNSKKTRKKNNSLTQMNDKLICEKVKGSPNIVENSKNSVLLKKTGRKGKKMGTKVNEKNLIESNSIENVCNTSVKIVTILDKKEVANSINNDEPKPVEGQFLKNIEIFKTIDNNNKGDEDDVIFKTPLKHNFLTKKTNAVVATKRRGTKVLKSNIPKKKVKKKQLQENMQNSIENYLKSSSESEKKNLSHQLFSESREQELINSLNMTLQESPLQQKNIITDSTLHKTNINSQKQNEICPEKDFKILKIKEGVKQQNQNAEFQINNKNCLTDNVKEQQIIHNTLLQCEPLHSENAENIQNNALSDCEKNCKQNLESSAKIKKSNFKNKELPEVNENKNLVEKHKSTYKKSTPENKNDTLSSVQDVFKLTSQLSSFIESQPGCFTKECWSLKNFKCGILKLKPKSKIGSKTAYDNSYFGGVVLQGSLKIYIEKQKLELQEGGMAFVPPLSEWMILNLRKTEAVMYYWFGRFRA